jgi:hypothetical protein
VNEKARINVMHQTNAINKTNPNKLKTKAIIKQKMRVTNVLDPGSKIFTDISLRICMLTMSVGRRSIHWWNTCGNTVNGKE